MTQPHTIFVTGASGFVGSALVARLSGDERYCVRAGVHGQGGVAPDGVALIHGMDLTQPGDWSQALAGVDCLIHAAARVHVMHETVPDALAEFRRINAQGTLNLAQQAAAAGVRRFIFLSSVKVNGEGTFDKPFAVHDQPQPVDAYGVSKWEAEQGLEKFRANTSMEIVALRLPLVYGPGMGGNFATMVSILQRGWPLPLALVRDNRRSLVALENVIDLVITCIDHPAAANRTFMVSDGEDVSTADLLRRTASAMDKKPKLFPLPLAFLRLGAAMIGRSEAASRLLGSLQVEMTETRKLLGWTPPIGLDEGLRRAVGSIVKQGKQCV